MILGIGQRAITGDPDNELPPSRKVECKSAKKPGSECRRHRAIETFLFLVFSLVIQSRVSDHAISYLLSQEPTASRQKNFSAQAPKTTSASKPVRATSHTDSDVTLPKQSGTKQKLTQTGLIGANNDVIIQNKEPETRQQHTQSTRSRERSRKQINCTPFPPQISIVEHKLANITFLVIHQTPSTPNPTPNDVNRAQQPGRSNQSERRQ